MAKSASKYRLGQLPVDEIENWLNDEIAAGIAPSSVHRHFPAGMGVTFELDVSHKSVPIHVFDIVEAFRDLMRRTVHDTLRQGTFGWEVTDCHLIMTDCGYQAPPRKWPGTTLSDYRLLTPIVLMVALKQAGTTVREPALEFHMEFPGTLESAFASYRPIDGLNSLVLRRRSWLNVWVDWVPKDSLRWVTGRIS